VHVLIGNSRWMLLNLILAAIPFAFACVLFIGERRRLSVTWWLGGAAFLAFLPNAPYVMTDVIHVPGDLQAVTGRYGATTALMLQYGVLIVFGLAAYAGSLELLRRFLVGRGWTARSIAAVQLAIHAACAVGVLLGRFARFNSWDLGTRPGAVVDHLRVKLDNPGSWKLLIMMFAALYLGTAFARVAGRVLHAATEKFLRGPDGRA
jgi:uncharacterized membrane protein